MAAGSSTVSAGSNAACRLQIENGCPYRAATPTSAKHGPHKFMCNVHIRKNVLLCKTWLCVCVFVFSCLRLHTIQHQIASTLLYKTQNRSLEDANCSVLKCGVFFRFDLILYFIYIQSDRSLRCFISSNTAL